MEVVVDTMNLFVVNGFVWIDTKCFLSDMAIISVCFSVYALRFDLYNSFAPKVNEPELDDRSMAQINHMVAKEDINGTTSLYVKAISIKLLPKRSWHRLTRP
eukprot:96972_1